MIRRKKKEKRSKYVPELCQELYILKQLKFHILFNYISFLIRSFKHTKK